MMFGWHDRIPMIGKPTFNEEKRESLPFSFDESQSLKEDKDRKLGIMPGGDTLE